jgi:hypothetical protein
MAVAPEIGRAGHPARPDHADMAQFDCGDKLDNAE